MRRVSLVFTVLGISLLVLISCTTNDNTVSPAEFRVTLAPNVLDSTLTDVFVHNIKKDQYQLFITLTDVEIQHYHPAEFHRGSVYIIRRKDGNPETKDQWRDELWKYTSMKQGIKIFSSHGLDFRTSPQEKNIALIADTTLHFIDATTHTTVAQFYPAELSPFHRQDTRIQLLEWSKDGRSFWGTMCKTVDILSFFCIMPEKWSVDSYNVDTLRIQSTDFAVNPESGLLVYSDYPAIFDVISYESIKKSKIPIHLYLFDLKSGNKKILTTTYSKQFKPLWLSTKSIEIDNPAGKGRVIISI